MVARRRRGVNEGEEEHKKIGTKKLKKLERKEAEKQFRQVRREANLLASPKRYIHVYKNALMTGSQHMIEQEKVKREEEKKIAKEERKKEREQAIAEQAKVCCFVSSDSVGTRAIDEEMKISNTNFTGFVVSWRNSKNFKERESGLTKSCWIHGRINL
jgi:hypothetical protein